MNFNLISLHDLSSAMSITIDAKGVHLPPTGAIPGLTFPRHTTGSALYATRVPFTGPENTLSAIGVPPGFDPSPPAPHGDKYPGPPPPPFSGGGDGGGGTPRFDFPPAGNTGVVPDVGVQPIDTDDVVHWYDPRDELFDGVSEERFPSALSSVVSAGSFPPADPGGTVYRRNVTEQFDDKKAFFLGQGAAASAGEGGIVDLPDVTLSAFGPETPPLAPPSRQPLPGATPPHAPPLPPPPLNPPPQLRLSGTGWPATLPLTPPPPMPSQQSHSLLPGAAEPCAGSPPPEETPLPRLFDPLSLLSRDAVRSTLATMDAGGASAQAGGAGQKQGEEQERITPRALVARFACRIDVVIAWFFF